MGQWQQPVPFQMWKLDSLLTVVYGENWTFRIREGKHINFLIDWANEEKCDWMTLEDCDCFPTQKLQEVGKHIFVEAEELSHFCVKLQRIYLYGVDKWFAKNKTNINWAWKPSLNIFVDEDDPWGIVTKNMPEIGYTLYPPLAMLHDFSPTPEIGKSKIHFYNKSNKMGKLPSLVEILGNYLIVRIGWQTNDRSFRCDGGDGQTTMPHSELWKATPNYLILITNLYWWIPLGMGLLLKMFSTEFEKKLPIVYLPIESNRGTAYF